mgnify:CR=1 FL=1
MTKSPITYYPHKEEVLNVITHFLGFVLSVAALALLVTFASIYGTVWHIVSFSIFGSTMVVLYLASTLYHSARRKTLRQKLNVFDHSAIYLLIAGTYTPFMIDELRGGWGWSLFGVIWGLAVVGIIVKLFWTGRFQLISTLVYVAMGWLVLIAIKPMVAELSSTTLIWLVAGGVAYTVGTPFFHRDQMRHSHAIWHLFVIAGTACHAVAVASII